MKSVFIVVVNYKGQIDTLECLESLQKINKEDFSLSTVVINNSPDQPLKIDEKEYGNVGLKIIYSKENLGFAGGMNMGIDYALINGADSVLILNNDTIVHPDFLKELVGMEIEKGPGIYSPKIYFAKGFEFHKSKYKESDLGKVIWYAGGKIDWKNIYGSHVGVDVVDNGQFDRPLDTDFATGCCFLISREVLKKVGKFNEKYFLYYEDLDLSIRAKKDGYKIIFTPASVIWHKNAGSSGGSGSGLQDYYITRNRMIFGMRYASLRGRAALIKESIVTLKSGRQWQKKGIADFYKRRFGKGSFAV